MKSKERKWWLQRIATEIFHIKLNQNFFEMSMEDITSLHTLADICHYRRTDNGKSIARAFFDYITSDIKPF